MKGESGKEVWWRVCEYRRGFAGLLGLTKTVSRAARLIERCEACDGRGYVGSGRPCFLCNSQAYTSATYCPAGPIK